MTFALDIKKWVDDCEKKQDQFVRKICLDLTSQVVLGTPVDLGRAINNWFPSIGSPSNATTTATDKSGSGSIARAKPVINQATGNVFYLTNNLPYIRRLEFEGWSKQARRGWVRAAVRRVATTYR